jgi:erythromycin esterase-like protein
VTVDDWIGRDAIPFRFESATTIESAVDRIMRSLSESVELLGFGEALHGSEEILVLRNRLFQRLVEAHGYSAVVIEVTSPQARVMNDYVLGRRDAQDEAVQAWFSEGFGTLHANRELIEWLRDYSRGAAHDTKLHFYGFDLPLGDGALASPGRVLEIVFDYLDAVAPAAAGAYRQRMLPLIGETGDWEKPVAWFDPSQSIGLSERATALRDATLDLITDLRIRRPELVAKSDPLAFADAVHHARLGRQLLDAHAALATPGAYARMLGIRDLIMADNLEHFLALEHGRGKVLVFAASGHLKRGLMQWRLPPEPGVKEWWPAGAQLAQSIGPRYAVIGMALGVSEANGVGVPEPDTVEARMMQAGRAFFIPTRRDDDMAPAPVRSGSELNPTYAPLTPDSFIDFDALVFLPSTGYPRGALPLSSWNG